MAYSSKSTTGMQISFPDVCKVPAPPAPFVPAPLPNIGSSRRPAAAAPSSAIKLGQSRTKMNAAHQKLQALAASASPQQWQDLLEEYVLAAVETYKSLHGA
jgi:hypothetical protein